MSDDLKIQHGHAGSVEIILDGSGIVLNIDSSEQSQRFANDIVEGESLSAHIHPDDYDFFLWSCLLYTSPSPRD